LELVALHDELDVSGAALEKRARLRTAVETIEDGQAQVVVYAYLDRMCRSLAVRRIPTVHSSPRLSRLDASIDSELRSDRKRLWT
jgi:hypothetical protein